MSEIINKAYETRLNPSQLPTYEELCDILAHEAKRPIPEGKEAAHFSDFSTMLDLLKSYRLSTMFFEQELQSEDFKDPKLFSEVSIMFKELADSIVRTQNDAAKQELFNNMYDYLAEVDAAEPADLIFVFGSKATARIETAIRLFKEGLAPKILISGGGPFYELSKGSTPEARLLANYALEQGVPQEALILETESITVPDNIKRSLNLLEDQAIPHQNIILVNSPFAQRRGWAHFNKMCDVDTKLMRTNSDTVSEQFSRNGWYRNETGAKIITKEFFGMRMSTILNTA